MQVSVEKVSSVERRVTIVVPANQVEEAFSHHIHKFASQANIKGFRPGKAPINYIKERFGAEARREAINEVAQKALYEALVSEKLRPVSTPRVEPKSILADQPLEIVASFEVLPEIEQVSFALDKVEKPIVEITDEDIDRVIQQLSKQFTQWKSVDREAKENDRLVIDYYAIFDGKSEEENKAKDFSLELGSKMMLPGFEEGLIGVKKDETRHLKLAFPDNFSAEDKAGKPVEFVVTVKQIFEADMPAMNEDFIKQLGIVSGKDEDLKNQIKQTLQQERDRLVREKLKEQVFKGLLEQNPIEVPPSLVGNEAKNIHDEIYPQHQHAEHHSHSDEEWSSFKDIAKKRVALGILIAEYAKKSHIEPDKARVNKRMQEIASAYEKPEEVIAWLSSDERRGGIEAQILEDQVMEKLLETVTVADKNMSYADLKGIRI